MKLKRLCGVFSIGALAALALVGCGYDQNTGGVDEQAEIVDDDLKYIKSTVWGFGSLTIYDDETDINSGYSQIATLQNGEELKFADITGVESITYTYYKRVNYKASDIYKQSLSSYEGALTLWDDDKIHVNAANIGSKQAGNNVKANGEYLVVLSFEVNEKRYKPIQDLVLDLNVYTKPVITESNFTFNNVTVPIDQVPGDGYVHYASVTVGDKTYELKPTANMSDADLKALGLSGISYNYYSSSDRADKNKTDVPSRANTQTYVFVDLIPAAGYQTPVVSGSYAVTYIQGTASAKTIDYVMNNNKVAQVEPKTTTAATFTDDLLPTFDNVPGYHFDGWYADEALTQQVNNLTSITGNMTLHAKWTQTAFTVSYEENLVGVGDFLPDAELVTSIPSILPSLTDPNGNYQFVDWYTDPACTTAATPGAAITADTTLYAKWNNVGDLPQGTLLNETFDIIHPESISGVTVNGNTYSNTNGALIITPDGANTGTIDFDFDDIVNTEEVGKVKTATISFKLTEAVNAGSWASFRLYGSSTILDNSGTKDKFAIRWNGNRADSDDTTYAKVAGTTYTYTITAVFTATGMNITVTATDGVNDPYTLVENHAVTDTKLSHITFGNAKDVTRILTLDDLSVSYVVNDLE